MANDKLETLLYNLYNPSNEYKVSISPHDLEYDWPVGEIIDCSSPGENYKIKNIIFVYKEKEKGKLTHE